jgi:hypothetical protein
MATTTTKTDTATSALSPLQKSKKATKKTQRRRHRSRQRKYKKDACEREKAGSGSGSEIWLLLLLIVLSLLSRFVLDNASFSGLCAGVLTGTVLYPLTLIETKQQVAATKNETTKNTFWFTLREIVGVKKNGAFGVLVKLYSGAFPAVLGEGINWMVYSYLYVRFIEAAPYLLSYYFPFVFDAFDNERNDLSDLLSGMATGIVTCFIVNPLWVIKVRLITNDHKTERRSVWKEVKCLVREEGVLALWAGVFVSCLGCVEGAVQFLIVENIKRQSSVISSGHRSTLGSMMWIGALARMAGVALCYPYQTVRSIVQTKEGFVWKAHCRLSSLYAGMWTKLVKEAVYGGVFTFLREKMLK